MKKIGLLVALVLAGITLLAAAGCSSDSASTQVKTLYVGTQNDYPPFAFADTANQLTGFDIDVIKEIEKRLPGYKLEFQPAPWDSIFLSLDSGKTQLVADEVAVNPEREKKYLFSEPYFNAESVIIVKKGRTDIKSLDDLQGKNVAASVGDSYTQLLEEYNATHAKKINLKYSSTGGPADVLQDIASGRVDAYVNDPVMTKAIIKQLGLAVEIVGVPIKTDNIALVFTKDANGEALKAQIDPIIKQLKADGTLKKLSVKWTAGEYIPQ
jgi:L-cystine transport system substrate-binding protein